MNPHAPYTPERARFGGDAVARYDAEIADADAEVAVLLAELGALGRRDRAIVVVAADHGEAFGEHGTRFHNQDLSDGQTHVPLIVALPGAAPRVVDGPVSLVDLAPTLLDLVGLPAPAGMNGVSLAGAILTGEPVPEHDVLSEKSRLDTPLLVALHRPGGTIVRDLVANTTVGPATLRPALDAAIEAELSRVPE